VAEEPKSQYFKKTEDLYRDKLLKKRSYVKYYAYFKNIDKDADKYREPAIKQLRSRYRTESRQKRINNDRLKKLVNQIVLLAGEKSKAARAIKEDHATLYQRRAKAQREADRRHQQSQAKKTEALKCIIGYRYQKCAGRIRHDLVRCKENSVRECCAKFGMRRSADFTGCR
jgi:hypothetical protein